MYFLPDQLTRMVKDNPAYSVAPENRSAWG